MPDETPADGSPMFVQCTVAMANGQVQPSATPISYSIEKLPDGQVLLMRLNGPNGAFFAFLEYEFARQLANDLNLNSGGILVPTLGRLLT
jgi:hypothetical protein